MPSSADPGKTIIVPPLKYICLSSYLAFLESACAGNFYNCADTTFQNVFFSLHPTADEPESSVQATHIIDVARTQEPPGDHPLRSLLLSPQVSWPPDD